MSATDFFISASAIAAMSLIGFVGDAWRTHDYSSRTVSNSAPQAVAVKTIAITTVTNGASYPITIDGITVTYVADGSATAAEIANGLIALIEAEPGHRVTVTYDATITLTVRGLWPGVDFALSTSSGLMTLATVTAADDADPLFAGRLLIRTGEVPALGGALPAKHPVAADFTAQTAAATITASAGSTFNVEIDINGATYRSNTVAFASDATVTAAAIATALNAALPANTVNVTSALGVLTFTAEVPGAEFALRVSSAGTSTFTLGAAVGPSAATSLRRKLCGVAERRTDVEPIPVGQLPAAQGAVAMTRGRMVVARAAAETWLAGQGVFVGVGASDAGSFYNAAAANRVWIGSDLIRIEQQHESGLGVIVVGLGV